MKFVPTRVTRFVGMQKIKLSKNSPTLLLAAGVVGVVGTTVLASRATLKAQPIVEATTLELDRINYNADKTGQRVPEPILRRQRVEVYLTTASQLAKLYGPAIIVGTISVGCLIKSHNIQKDRYSNLAAAYIAIEESFAQYRKRVVDEVGEERERELYYDGQNISVLEPGPNGPKKKTIKVAGPNGGSIYARLFNEENPNWKTTPEFNLFFLRQTEQWLNQKLRSEGYLFLNRAYEELGMDATEQGAVCGWLYERGTGDDAVDFGIWSDAMKERVYDFMVGNEGDIMLDFNVDGPIYKLLDKPKVKG